MFWLFAVFHHSGATPVPMNRFERSQDLWNQSNAPNTEENSTSEVNQPSGDLFGDPNQFLQSGGLIQDYDYLPDVQLAPLEYPDMYQRSPISHQYSTFYNTMPDSTRPEFYGGLPHPDYPNLAKYQEHHPSQSQSSQSEEGSSSQHQGNVPKQGSSFGLDRFSEHQRDLSRREKIKEITTTRKEEATTDRLALYDWEKSMDREDVVKIFEIMGTYWIEGSGPVRKTTLQRCTRSLGDLLERNPDFPRKILVHDSTILPYIFNKTKPRFSVNRIGQNKEPFWSLEQLIQWLKTPIDGFRRNFRAPSWAISKMTRDERDEIVATLCRVWDADPSKITKRLLAANKRENNLVQTMIPHLQSIDKSQVKFAADILMPPGAQKRAKTPI